MGNYCCDSNQSMHEEQLITSNNTKPMIGLKQASFAQDSSLNNSQLKVYPEEENLELESVEEEETLPTKNRANYGNQEELKPKFIDVKSLMANKKKFKNRVRMARDSDFPNYLMRGSNLSAISEVSSRDDSKLVSQYKESPKPQI